MKTKLVSVTLGQAEYDALAELAARRQITIASVIRAAVLDHILTIWPAGLERVGDDL